jgi:hypothetical protein
MFFWVVSSARVERVSVHVAPRVFHESIDGAVLLFVNFILGDLETRTSAAIKDKLFPLKEGVLQSFAL